MKRHDRLALPRLDPEVARRGGVVAVAFAESPSPLVEPIAPDADPGHKERDRQAGERRVEVDELDDGVASFGGGPAVGQTAALLLKSDSCLFG